MNATNTFKDGLMMDTNPLATPNTVLTNCLNGTLVTSNGNELILLNDTGNTTILYKNSGKEHLVKLNNGFVPIGIEEFGGILYIFSVNPNKLDELGRYLSEIGSFPSPDIYENKLGYLVEDYKPLHNLDKGNGPEDFLTYNLNFDLQHPLVINSLRSYDGTVNLIFTDNKNIPRLINTRFTIFGDNLWKIVDRKIKEDDTNDTNLYIDSDLTQQTSLNKIVQSIVDIQFDEVLDGGNLPVGNYTFYFTLADLDDNESDFIGQSGIVTCHKGNLNDPFSIDGGIADLNSNKLIRFTFNNIPKGYIKLYVYYSRETCDENGTIITKYKKIKDPYYFIKDISEDKFITTLILITGFELTIDSSQELINLQYFLLEKSKALTISQNILFEANVTSSKEKLYKDLEKIALNITGTFEQTGDIGHLDGEYNDDSNKNEYYNTLNIYHSVGYWPNEYYRFGVVFIMSDYSLSPVFNIHGNVNESTGEVEGAGNEYGVFKVPDFDVLSESKPISIKFNLSNISQQLTEKDIKGYFFVRLKRIKTIIAQGVRIGYDKEYSRLPLLYTNYTTTSARYSGLVLNGAVFYKDGKFQFYTYVDDKKMKKKYKGVDGYEERGMSDFEASLIGGLAGGLVGGILGIIFNPDNDFSISKKVDTLEQLEEYLKTVLEFTDEDLEPILEVVDYVDSYNEGIEDGDESKKKTIEEELEKGVQITHVVEVSGSQKEVNILDWFTLTFIEANRENSKLALTNMTFFNDHIYKFDIQYMGKGGSFWLGIPGDGKYMEHIAKDSLTRLCPTYLFREYARYNVDKCLDKQINGKSIQSLDKNVKCTAEALLCPEYEVNQPYYNSLFTGTEFNYRTQYSLKYSNTESLLHIYPTEITKKSNPKLQDKTYIIAVPELSEGVKNKENVYSSVAGTAADGIKFKMPFTNFYTMVDLKVKDNKIDDIEMKCDHVNISGITRGIWGPYLGIELFKLGSDGEDVKVLKFETSVYNIEEILVPNYNDVIKNSVEVRKNDSSEFYPITPRINISNPEVNAYNGDCFICNFTHRMNRNFQDPSFPINDDIVDYKTHGKAYRYKINDDLAYEFVKGVDDTDLEVINRVNTTIDPESLIFLNRADINAVLLGHWITVKVLASTNLSMRSVDTSNVTEVAVTGNGRSFYPLRKFDTSGNNKISDSYLLSEGYGHTVGRKMNILQSDNPAIQEDFSTRIYYSNPTLSSENQITNQFRIFINNHYRDYTRSYGKIIKLLNYYDKALFVVFEHAIALIAVNEKAIAAEMQSEYAFINTRNVLAETPSFLTTDFGSQWADSVILTRTGIYGVDTVTKKIWMYDTQFKTLSEFAINKFLKDNINISEYESEPDLGRLNVKTHYNKHKQDIMFTFYNIDNDPNKNKMWNVCYNEITKKWTTFYSWIPSYSGNINNTFYSFDYRYTLNPIPTECDLLWKHNINNNWCNWYGSQHPFEFEFVVADNPQIHKILNYLHMVANKTKPESFHFEIVGEVYNFSDDKKNMYYRLERTKEMYKKNGCDIKYDEDYLQVPLNLQHISTLFPLYVSKIDRINEIYDEYLRMTSNSRDYQHLSGSEIVYDKVTNDFDIATHIKAYTLDDYEWYPVCGIDESNVKLLKLYYLNHGIEVKEDEEYLYKKVEYGRRLGNCSYKEDLWKIQVPSINYVQVNERKWKEPPICIETNPLPEDLCSADVELDVPTDTVCEYNIPFKQTRIRDKYIKIKVRYSGNDLAIILAIISQYKESYS